MGFWSDVGDFFGGVGGAVGTAFDIGGAAKDREQSQAQFEANRWDKYVMYDDQKRYNTHMANTAYQRQKADMEAAGINPMLAVMKGGGAPAPTANPSPNQGLSPVVNRPSIGEGIARAAGTAFQSARVAQEIRESESRVHLQTAERDTELTKQEFNVASAVAALKGAGLTGERHTQLRSEREAVAAEARLRKKTSEIDETMAVPDAIGTRAKSVVESILGSLKFWQSSGKKNAPGVPGPHNYRTGRPRP
ncbi:MAG: hypothetical protein IT285_03365 [Bdellovibrionales bacterium]|nr:hypothetical protein [Bdellovibrionales bacterium]